MQRGGVSALYHRMASEQQGKVDVLTGIRNPQRQPTGNGQATKLWAERRKEDAAVVHPFTAAEQKLREQASDTLIES